MIINVGLGYQKLNEFAKEFRGNQRVIVDCKELSDVLWQRVKSIQKF